MSKSTDVNGQPWFYFVREKDGLQCNGHSVLTACACKNKVVYIRYRSGRHDRIGMGLNRTIWPQEEENFVTIVRSLWDILHIIATSFNFMMKIHRNGQKNKLLTLLVIVHRLIRIVAAVTMAALRLRIT